MNIRLVTDVSIGSGSYESGAILECEQAEAERLIKLGLAEATDAPASAPEAAMHGEAEAHATLPKARARG